MKKIVWTMLAAICACVAYAQEKDVTRFLGIPVDGSKSEMIQKLRAKGFKSSFYDKEALEGEFNGTEVSIYVVSNKEKVYRVAVYDVHTVDEPSIKIRFNRLCSQFSNNPNYISTQDYSIPNDEDISYEITVHKKRYEAAFYQIPNIDSTAVDKIIKDDFIPRLRAKFTQGQINASADEMKHEIREMAISYLSNLAAYKSVWFMIAERRGEYYIAMYYDNTYNQANGEDL